MFPFHTVLYGSSNYCGEVAVLGVEMGWEGVTLILHPRLQNLMNTGGRYHTVQSSIEHFAKYCDILNFPY